MEKITMYKCTNGKIFDTQEKAREYVADETKKHIRALLIRAAQKADCRGFVGNYAEEFTESIFSDIHELQTRLDFYFDNQGA